MVWSVSSGALLVALATLVTLIALSALAVIVALVAFVALVALVAIIALVALNALSTLADLYVPQPDSAVEHHGGNAVLLGRFSSGARQTHGVKLWPTCTTYRWARPCTMYPLDLEHLQ